MLHARIDGPDNGRALMFGNSLGTDLRIWDALLPHLPGGLRIVRFDKRGHGLSDCPTGPYAMDTLVADAATVAEALGLRRVTFVGLSIGGLIGQGLAASRPDLLQALILMDTAAKIGTRELWQERIDSVAASGVAGIADAILERWFTDALLQDAVALAPLRNMLCRTPPAGYAGCCAAIAEADFTEATSGLSLPVTAIVGAEDKATPPDLVRGTAALCKAPCHVVADAGHLPCVERPAETGGLIARFLEETRHA